MKVIVNADDFGINSFVTKEIERLIEVGAISSTSIMANGDSLDEVKAFVPLHPEISFGVHLCLSEYDSLTKSSVFFKHGITNENGEFVKLAIFKVKHFDDELKLALEAELTAQIQRVKMLGVPVSHCDSHHHVHTIPSLCGIFAKVMKQEGVTAIRRCWTPQSFKSKINFISRFRKLYVDRFYGRSFSMTDALFSYRQMSAVIGADDYLIELMCHPGHPGQIYKDEIVLVESMTLLDSHSVELISYMDIK